MTPVSPDKGLHNHPGFSYLSVANGKSVMNPDTFFFFLHLRLSTHLSLSLDKKGCGSPIQKISELLFCIALTFHYLCRRIGSVLSNRTSGLKGNRVKVPNSPAAVKLQFQLIEKDFYATDVTYIGKVPVRESVRRPAIIHVWSTSRVREANTNK